MGRDLIRHVIAGKEVESSVAQDLALLVDFVGL
jgi:hypothetical protein